MEKAVSVARDDLSSIRTGRANPGMFSRIIDRLLRLDRPRSRSCPASTCPRPGWSSSSPTSSRSSSRIEDAIRNSDLGVNPSNDGNVIRIADSAADRGASARPGQAGQVQGRGRQGVGAQHPPQGDGGAAPHQEGRRGRRGRGRPRREGSRQDHRTRTPTRSTSWSSTKKASCWRSSGRPATDPVADTDTAPRRSTPPKKTSRAGRNLPAAIAVGAFLGFGVIAILLFAPIGWVAGAWRWRSPSPPTRSSAGCARRATRSR